MVYTTSMGSRQGATAGVGAGPRSLQWGAGREEGAPRGGHDTSPPARQPCSAITFLLCTGLGRIGCTQAPDQHHPDAPTHVEFQRPPRPPHGSPRSAKFTQAFQPVSCRAREHHYTRRRYPSSTRTDMTPT